MDSELEQVVREDLQFLTESWQTDLSDSYLRRDSAVLRRLLIDNGHGLLPRYWQALGRPGKHPRVEATLFHDNLGGAERDDIECAFAGKVHYGHGTLFSFIEARSSSGATEPQGPQSVQKVLKLPRFLDSTVLIVEGTRVRRRDVISYIANRKGGVHLDSGRDRAQDKAVAALDATSGKYELIGKDIVYLALLSIGQNLITTPDVAALLG